MTVNITLITYVSKLTNKYNRKRKITIKDKNNKIKRLYITKRFRKMFAVLTKIG